MKILQVMAGSERGGAETAFVDMCIAMHESGQTIEVVTRANDLRVPQLKQAGIKVYTLPFGGTVDIFTPMAMKKIIKKFQPDIVQTWMSRASWKTPAWSADMNIPRYAVVSRLGGYYKLKYFKSADYFATITPAIKTYLLDQGIEDERVRHINNFAETEDIITPVRRADFETPDDATLLIALGRLHESKAFDTLIKSIINLPDVYLWIAGEGPQRPELETLIETLNLKSRVKLLGWRSDRAALFQASDICVFPSRYEPFGTVFVQAWANKVPLITTDSDGPHQFVRPGQDGLMVQIDDIRALQDAIAALIQDKPLGQKLVENGYTRYLSEFTKEKCLLAYLAFYDSIRAKMTQSLKNAQ